MNRRGFLRWGALGTALFTVLHGTRLAIADPVRHSPKEFHDFPMGGFGGQQGLVTFFIENREDLELSDEQVTRLQPILDETRRRFQELRARHKPEIKAIQSEQVRQIRAILNQNQLGEFEKMREEHEKRHAQGR